MSQSFTLHPSVNADALRAAFAARGRVQIAPFLEERAAKLLSDHLRTRSDWRLVLNAGEKVFEMERSAYAALSRQQKDQLEKMVAAAGRSGFQYRYESIRVPDRPEERVKSGTLLDDFAMFMASEAVLELLGFITGAADIDFADAQGTSYGTGHFLTMHDDDVEGKGRRAAYVYGLTSDWRAEWGGLLMFHGSDGNIEEGFTPAWNNMRLFAVPAKHSVSYVAPLAPKARISVTGWLRAGVPA